MPDKEIRTISGAEIRADGEGDATKIVGRIVYDTPSDAGGSFREVIRPGAFANALSEKQDVRALFNHDSNVVLGRSTSGTLKMAETDDGLDFEIDPPDTQAARDVMALVSRGDIDGSSFAFMVREGGETWSFPDDGLPLRELTDLDLFDVSPVTYPFYEESSAATRSMEDARPVPAPTHNPDLLRRKLELESLR